MFTAIFNNLILNTDSYKASHFLQYPPNSEIVSSYIEARKNPQFDQVLFFGLQAFIKEYLLRPITREQIDEAEAIFLAHGEPFNRAGWEWILEEHLGFLPVTISALPEGVIVPTGTALVQIHNADPHTYWLPSYLETALLRAVWYPSTVATISWKAKQIIQAYLEKTCDDPASQLAFKLHDFGARGVSSQETAALGGMAHLVNFMGTDTVAALLAAKRYYGAAMAAYSIPAAEHSTITSWGRAREVDAYANMLKQFAKPNKVLAVVSDSYDIYRAVSELWGEQLRQQVIDSGATVVIRPDSGDPKTVVVEVLERLYAQFGGRLNQKGYKVLADCVRVIQGDGVNLDSMGIILEHIKQHGFSTENVAFGMGAGLLQKVNRDTLNFAMKASAIRISNQWQDVYKQPITDPGKNSRRGRLAVIHDENGWQTIPIEQLGQAHNQLRHVFRDGKLLVDDDFETVRARTRP
ncbi:nicotinate phosphoribosyltransferase [Thiolinea disciformis]|uniref:nicotinate phosphoribosyltransferase n=1 Tax=Thiolinea disciformis TaxID=125614 RepID=UPI000376F99C|nr:nicotinate phosphoribosyltransferase [Thiolinea disciformis]